MHEVSLLESVLNVIEEQAVKQRFQTVKKVVLEVGKLSCVEAEALRFAFDAVMKNTLAQQADLEIVVVDGRGVCRRCGRTQDLQSFYDACGNCGDAPLAVLQGDALRIKELIVS
jgi:hydrogenase nickel incorporation protein HypA/HybF